MDNNKVMTVSNAPIAAGMIAVKSRKDGHVTAIRPTSKKAFVDKYMKDNPNEKRSHVEKVVFRSYLNQVIQAQSDATRDAIASGKIRVNQFKFNADGVLTNLGVERPDVTSAAQAQLAVDRIVNADASSLTAEDVDALEKKLAEARKARADAAANKAAEEAKTSAPAANAEVPQPANA